MSTCCKRQSGERRELIKSEQIQYVTALNRDPKIPPTKIPPTKIPPSENSTQRKLG